MTRTVEELASLEVSEILHEQGSVFDPEDPSSKALGYMKDTGRYEVVAAKGNRVGIITVRSLLGVDHPHRTRIDSVWDQIGVASPIDDVLAVVETLMANGVRAIPVYDREGVVGVVSQMDIIQVLTDVSALSALAASQFTVTPVETMDIKQGIAQARRTMLDKGISHIAVTRDGKLAGEVTAEQIVHTFTTSINKTTRGDRTGEKVTRFPGIVETIIDTDPFTVSPEANIYEVIKGFVDTGKGACFIVNEADEVLGVITPREVLDVFKQYMPEAELPITMIGITEEDFFERSTAENKLRRVVNRSLRMYPDITEVIVNVEKQRTQGERIRYNMKARVLGPSTTFQATNEDWGLMETFDGLCQTLDKTMRRSKKEPQKGARRDRRRPNPHHSP